MQNMKISELGLEHLIKLEGGAKLTRYNDLGENSGHCTIGVGHLIHKGVCNGIIPSEKPFLKNITKQEAKDLLKKDVAISENDINGSVIVQLNQNQFDALVSFVFNIGGTSFRRSTLLKYINLKQFSKASDEFLKWNKMTIGGEKIEIKGLINRRIAEKHIFDTVK